MAGEEREGEERGRQEQEQMVTMAAALRIDNSSPGAWSPPMQRSHAHSAPVDQSDRGSGGSNSTGYRTRQNVPAAEPQGPLPYRGKYSTQQHVHITYASGKYFYSYPLKKIDAIVK